VPPRRRRAQRTGNGSSVPPDAPDRARHRAAAGTRVDRLRECHTDTDRSRRISLPFSRHSQPAVVVSDIPAIRAWAQDAVSSVSGDVPVGLARDVASAVGMADAERRRRQSSHRGFRWRAARWSWASFSTAAVQTSGMIEPDRPLSSRSALALWTSWDPVGARSRRRSSSVTTASAAAVGSSASVSSRNSG
jgi:hypothetical protein